MADLGDAHFSILLGGTLTPTPRLLRQIAGSRVIAADGGILHAETLGVSAELWVGDFDSTPDATRKRLDHILREEHPTDKDRTDGEIAIEAAIARGATSLTLVSGLGGQADHVLGHFMLALRYAQEGLRVSITSGDEEAYPLLPGVHEFDLPAESRISIIPLSKLDGLSLKNVYWPLNDTVVALGSTRTLSNRAKGPVQVELESGYGMIIAYPE
ncbi:MAG: thiamine diphosphokinase [Hyphomicrobiales bacterium]